MVLHNLYSTKIVCRMRSSSEEEGGRSGSEQILGSIDSKENRELLDKIKDFNTASQLLKEKSNGGSAPETRKQGGFEREKVIHKQQCYLLR